MHRFTDAVLVVLVALAVTATAWADCAGEQNVGARMKCCATAHHKCAKSGDSSDCCQHMSHAATAMFQAVPLVKAPVVHEIVGPLLAASVSDIVPLAPASSLGFKHPHDPPHLHSFALLI